MLSPYTKVHGCELYYPMNSNNYYKSDLPVNRKVIQSFWNLAVYSNKARLVVGSHSGRLACLDPDDALAIWDIRLPDRIESSLSPSNCGTRGLIGCYDGKVYCICLSTGDILWTHKTNAMVKSTPILIDSKWIFGSHDYFVYCLAVTNGSVEWKWRMNGIVTVTPLPIAGNLVVVASLAGQVAALCSNTGVARWQISLLVPVFSSPTLVAGLLIVAVVSGSLHALSPETGIQVWSFEAGGQIFSSLVGVEESSSVVFGCHDSSVYKICIDPKGPKLLWRFQEESPVAATPIQFSPRHIVIASSSGRITVLDSEDVRSVMSIQLEGQTFSSPVVFKHSIFVGCRDNRVYCLKANKRFVN